MKTSRLTTRMLAVLLAGAALASACFLRASAPAVSQDPTLYSPQVARSDASALDPGVRNRARALLGKLPLYFIENRGQEDPRVAYYVQGRDTAVYFTGTGVTFALTGPVSDHQAAEPPAGTGSRRDAVHDSSRSLPIRRASLTSDRSSVDVTALTTEPRTARQRWAVQLEFVGAKSVAPRGEDLAPAVVSYFKGGASASTADQETGSSRSGLRTYRSLVYPELWPGIDLVYTGDAGHLKYAFLVKPGADPQQIRLAYRGATDVTLTDAGQLAVSTPVRGFTDDRPYAYQDADGHRDAVPVAFALSAAAGDAQAFGFTVGAYDRTRTLVLDPSVLVYAGYIGSSGSEFASGIAVDSAGNAYVVGATDSSVPSFPARVGPDVVFNGEGDAFVAKIKADGSDLVYLGYIGGAGVDLGDAIAVDKAGNAYITGSTDSDETTFPVKVGPRLVFSRGGPFDFDAFVAKVKADGTGLIYCGYIGGTRNDAGHGIAVDAAGNAYVTGITDSDETTFPVKVGPQLVHGGFSDAFVAKVKADGTGFAYAGYIGGAENDRGNAIAVDASGNAYVTGSTESDQTTFPLKIGPDLNFNLGSRDAFVAKVKADGTALVYAGYIGGASFDEGNAIAVDAAGNAYVTGVTGSDQSTFPVKIGPDLVHNGGTDAFVAKVKSDGTALVYTGYIGGSGTDAGRGIAVDAAGNAYVAGLTNSDQATFPVKHGPDLSFNGEFDAFVAQVKADGTALRYAGYVGGVNTDLGVAIAMDSGGNVYLTGSTSSNQASFPVTVGPELNHGGNVDAFVVKISGKPDLVEIDVATQLGAVRPGSALQVGDTVRNDGLGVSKASTTRYYLSADAFRGPGDILLGGSRLVPALEPGAFSGSTALVTIPTTAPLGTYHLLACADDVKAISELDDTNNCAARLGTIEVTLPDLAVSAVSNPPVTAKAGSQFGVFDNTANAGVVSALASTTRYYLSVDGVKNAGDILIGSRNVPALNPSSGAAGGTTATIPAGIAAGTYRLLACADDLLVVKEASETNNCIASPSAIQVTK